MPKLIRGDKLPEKAHAEVLAAFPYRWTHENEARLRNAHMRAGLAVPKWTDLMSDAEWLAAHAFYVNRDGSLTARRHAQPAVLVEG